MKNQKKLSIEDSIIHLNKSKDCYKDDDGYVYIIFNETVFDVKDFFIVFLIVRIVVIMIVLLIFNFLFYFYYPT